MAPIINQTRPDQTRPDQTRPDQTHDFTQIPSVGVIMSTYNGEKYLKEQIGSILAQKDVNVKLFIRDDGSTDSTKDIISDYVKRHENIYADFGKNVKTARSFINQLISASDCEYYAFSDQDDYWEQDKLISSVKLIKQKEAQVSKSTPIVSYSNLKVVDKDLNFIRKTTFEKRRRNLGSLTLRASIGGCTMVMNAKVRELVKSRPISNDILLLLHDTFIIFLVYSTGGILICNPEAHILYRQHGNNVAGSPSKLLPRIKKELRAMIYERGTRQKLARAFLQTWGDKLTQEAQRILSIVADYKENINSRMKIVLSNEFKTGDFRLTMLGKFKALFGFL